MNYLRASSTEFRLRYWTHALVFAIGFWAPWNPLVSSTRQSTWLTLASFLSRNFTLSFTQTTVALLVLGIVFAALAAALRTWGTACLGSFTVTNGKMKADHIVAEGPYRYVRNPLYLGTWLHAVALALLMTPTGAVFTIIVMAIMQARLIAGEEAFLSNSLGPAYTAYCHAVPRIVPSLSPRTLIAGAKPRWFQAIIAESYMIGVALVFATLGWRYNAFLLVQGVLVAFGFSILLRALLPPAPITQPAHSEKPVSDASV